MNHKTPGQLIAALLTKRGWTQRVLAIVLNMDETGVNKLVGDKRSVDAVLALALEEVFEVPAEDFLDLQRSFDLAKARITYRPDPGRATRALLYGDLPIAEMIKRGWIAAESVRDIQQVESELMRFFGANRLEDIEILPHAAKKTAVSSTATPAQLAWLYRVRQIAADMLVAPYSQQSLKTSVSKLQALVRSAEGVADVPRILAQSGVRFVLVESLPSAKIDGVCFWLGGKTPVIGMSLRFDRIDNFWFVLRHEIEHVLQGHGMVSAIIDSELEKDKAGTGEDLTDEERVANTAAQEFCVPSAMMDAFIARKAPFFTERDLIGFAKVLKVHPGLVAGQLQRKTGRYDRFRNHLTAVRELISPNAMKDGWGDVAPI
ncbi:MULTISPECIES: XRE family transcriptional regulator [unclassified Methylobacterium]|uniref:XRE family transcriptional regulator n=1 Tax=unclassified Methylobacterium TaxID=2615210 RepID=UPI0011C1E297|nr:MULTISPECIES: XRE family transcriptional regulator [unclassified Methylobacterium]QEE38187.1 XRE family transcriptional regulator [Methylobacterium sp. WL1]TXN55147.1 XRE family transcriptional regulator [Methylobacterium sp. WL2]